MAYVFIDIERRVIDVVEADDLDREMLASLFEPRQRWIYLGLQKDLQVTAGKSVSDTLIRMAGGGGAIEVEPDSDVPSWMQDDAGPAWTYATVEVDSGSPALLRRTLNDMGAQGWELVHVHDHAADDGYVLFKRPLLRPRPGSRPQGSLAAELAAC